MPVLSLQPFRDRIEAGQLLAERLAVYRDRDDVVVLALPRGGVPVAHQVAQSLHVPFDVYVVRKLGVPGHEELAMGAIASGGVRLVNHDVVEALGIPPAVIESAAIKEQVELVRREQLYRGARPPLNLANATVILVDDGLATGSTMRAAVMAVRQQRPARVVVAVPVGAASSCSELAREADELICMRTPEPFVAVGLWYRDFTPTSDRDVQLLLGEQAVVTWPSSNLYRHLVSSARAAAQPFNATRHDMRGLFDRLDSANIVLIGDASHGTQNFYHLRASITKHLIEHHGLTAVAVEADWPDAYRAHRFVCGQGVDVDANTALSGFERFPSWMWRNTEVLSFIRWLREWNDAHPARKVGFYGLDLYSLNTSIQAVIAYLDRVDPEAARRARDRYACFDHFAGDTHAYGYAASAGITEPCEDAVVNQLIELRNRAAEHDSGDDRAAADEFFFAEQNARLAISAEEYYRAIFRGRHSSWNIRDAHMADTVDALLRFQERQGQARPRLAVWAHNSHVGDARATELGDRGELNLGQLLRERHGDAARIIGFTTYDGTVTAASDWDADGERKLVRSALDGSVESLLHAVDIPQFVLQMHDERLAGFATPLLERAIGVIYRPQTERQSHYFHARVSEQFDVLIHVDRTTALVPLEPSPHWYHEEVPETYPSGL